LFVAAAIAASGGCESGSFMPPPPPELQSPGAEAAPANTAVPALDGLEIAPVGGKPIELILGRHGAVESEAYATAARVQAGLDKVKLKIDILGEADPPARQADFVRDALARNPLALIVEPADPEDARLTEALHDAQAKRVPIVLLNRPLSSGRSSLSGPSERGAEAAKGTAAIPGGPKPVVLVTSASFIPPANQLIGSAIRNAKNARLDPKGGAVIVINSDGDSSIEDRARAIRSALRSSVINEIEEVRFSGDLEVGARLVVERLKANPKPVMVFAVDSLSCAAIRHAKDKIIAERPFVMAGFAAEEHYSETAQFGEFAAVAEFAPLRVLRKAIGTAVSLAKGRSLPGRVEVPIIVSDSPENSGLPKGPPVPPSAKDAAKKGS
jgi:ABC-type sugar transport system substrate-binding protein